MQVQRISIALLLGLFILSPAIARQYRPVNDSRKLGTDPAERSTDPNAGAGRTDPESWSGKDFNDRLQRQRGIPYAAQQTTPEYNQEIVELESRIASIRAKIDSAGNENIEVQVQQLNQLQSELIKKLNATRRSTNAAWDQSRTSSAPISRNSNYSNRRTVAASPEPTSRIPQAAQTGDFVTVTPLPEGTITHQPLIQVRVRVVDVNRTDTLAAASILEYIASDPATAAPSFITGNNVNNDSVNATAGTRFDVNGLVGITGGALGGGTGALLNLTDTKINSIIKLLATELNGDLVTAPEVVTLNGQNVEFVAGDKVPFLLGQNVITGDTNSIQQFFYKHVGTYISVTPRIVNWSPLAKGRGKVARGQYVFFEDDDVLSIPELWADLTNNHSELINKSSSLNALYRSTTLKGEKLTGEQWPIVVLGFNQLIGQSIVHFDNGGNPFQQKITRRHLVNQFGIHLTSDCCNGCDWEPADCTIDLNLVVRLSGSGQGDASGGTTTETDVRAIANIVQVQNGHGVVIGGLIAESDESTLAKVPILGDLPLVGPLFRSKVNQRQKIETLIFVEARILDSDPNVSRVQSYEDMTLSQPYVQGTFLENPLEYGMCREGIGTYLPPASRHEGIYWERLGRKIRRAETTVDDYLK